MEPALSVAAGWCRCGRPQLSVCWREFRQDVDEAAQGCNSHGPVVGRAAIWGGTGPAVSAGGWPPFHWEYFSDVPSASLGTCGHQNCVHHLSPGSKIPSLPFFAPNPSAPTPPNYISQTALPTTGRHRWDEGRSQGISPLAPLCLLCVQPLQAPLTPSPLTVPPALPPGRTGASCSG